MKPDARRWVRSAAGLLVLGLLAAYLAARRPPPVVSETRFLMDTLVTLTLWGVAGDRATEAAEAAFAALEAVDREMARVPGTPLWELNTAGGGRLPPPLAEVLSAALAWAQRTRGAFDPTVAPLLDLWDVAAGPHPPPSPERLGEALAQVGWGKVRWDPGTRRADLRGTSLDFGGIAKGYAVDRAVEALRREGIGHFLLDAGGDLYVAGSKGPTPWRVGIQDPRDPDALLRVVEPREGALVTSGDYERFYEWQGLRIHHLLDPSTGEPAARCRSVTIWAPKAVDADALATAVFVLGPLEGLALLEDVAEAEGLVVDSEGRALETTGFSTVAPPRGSP